MVKLRFWYILNFTRILYRQVLYLIFWQAYEKSAKYKILNYPNSTKFKVSTDLYKVVSTNFQLGYGDFFLST